jgi:hypothetical protein
MNELNIGKRWNPKTIFEVILFSWLVYNITADLTK